IVLPAAADVALVDEILMLAQEPLGLLDRLLHEQPREERADDDEAVALEVSLERRSRRGGGAHALFLSAAVAPAGIGADQVQTGSGAATPARTGKSEAYSPKRVLTVANNQGPPAEATTVSNWAAP